MKNVIELEKEFVGNGEVKGFTFKQVSAKPEGFMYKVTCGNQSYYEVFKRKVVPMCVNFEKRIYSETDGRVRYPKSNAFGIWAWTFMRTSEAENKFNNLN